MSFNAKTSIYRGSRYTIHRAVASKHGSLIQLDEGATPCFKTRADMDHGWSMAFIPAYNCGLKEITEKQRRHLKGLAHPLRPVVLMGQAGLTDGVVGETVQALAVHELIKVRLPGLDRAQRDAAFQGLAERTESVLVTRIGHVAVLYRPRQPLPQIVLPD